MNEVLNRTNIEYHKCPDCGAGLENNVELAWETAPTRSSETHIPTADCKICGYNAGTAFGDEVAHELLATVGISPSEERERSETWGTCGDDE